VKGSFLKVITCLDEGDSATKDLCRFRLKDSKTDGMLVLALIWMDSFSVVFRDIYFSCHKFSLSHSSYRTRTTCFIGA
jgi:hypothetical protein